MTLRSRFCAIMATGIIVMLAAHPVSAKQKSKPLEYNIRVVIGKKTPLSKECYDFARNGSNTAEALQTCNDSLKKEALSKRQKSIVYANRAVIHYNIGLHHEAVADFTKALDLGIHYRAKIYTNRGLIYELLGHDALARNDYKAAIAFRSDYKRAQQRLEELKKPFIERSKLPRTFTADIIYPPKSTQLGT